MIINYFLVLYYLLKIMKTFLSFLIFAFLYNTSYAQDLEGNYKYYTEYIIFNNSHADFLIYSNGCVPMECKGIGKFEVLNDFLLIHTEEYKKKSNSTCEMSEKGRECQKIIVQDAKGQALPFVKIECFDRNNKVLCEYNTDFDGNFVIKNSDSISKLRLSAVGFNSLTFDYNANKNYKIKLAEGHLLENQTLVFKIINIEKNKLVLKLLSTDYKKSTSNYRTLKRLFKKKNKCNLEEKIFVK
jgi:hypothetical protein